MCGFVSCYYRLQDCGLRKKLERRQKKRDCAHLCVNVNYLPSGSYPKREAEQLERLVTTRKNKRRHIRRRQQVYTVGGAEEDINTTVAEEFLELILSRRNLGRRLQCDW